MSSSLMAPAELEAAIRATLDTHGFIETPILAYAAKFASAFYGPFREAAHSAPSHGDRRSHQMDPANGREAVRQAIDVRPDAPFAGTLRLPGDQVLPADARLTLRIENSAGTPVLVADETIMS